MSASPDQSQPNRLEALALTLIFAAISLTLLALLPWATRHGQASGGWWTRPALAPGVALGVLAVANVITLWREIAALRADPPGPGERAAARDCFVAWLRPLEFLAYYAVYVWAIQHIGYFPATLLFMLGLLLRVGLRSPGWLLAGALGAVALLLVFRIGLGVWMPAPDLYDLAPASLRSALIRWF